MADFGRYSFYGNCSENTYPYITDKTFEPYVKEIINENNKKIIKYISDSKSYEEYGNARSISITAELMGEKVHISVEILDKQPTLYVEGGYICFNLNESFDEIRIEKTGVMINPEKDIVNGANSALFAVDRYVFANGIIIKPVHSPLVCFGEPKIYRKNTGEFIKPKNGKVYFNLFNNMWATGCPQWIKGDFCFEFYILFEETEDDSAY